MITAPADGQTCPVAIVGGGPVGLTLALALARQGVRSVVLEEDGTVSDGSRALGMSRRTQDIWACLGLEDAVGSKGKPWHGGWTYYRGKLVLEYRIPHEPALRHPPMLNLQQTHAEQFLVKRIQQSELIDLRWRSRLVGLEDVGDAVVAGIEGDERPYALRCRYLVACDGARSKVRSALGLRMEGAAGEAQYLIVDVQIDEPMEMGRRAWFDPSSSPGATVLMHGQPDGIWRIDWQLPPDEDVDAALAPESIGSRVSAHLAMIGIHGPWRVVWVSTYRAHARVLPEFHVGRVALAGDAAHLIPIFGIRGLNSGIEDAWNLAWKLALVLDGRAPAELLATYSMERVAAARENLRLASRTLRFMTPPSQGWRLTRDAVLSLGLTQPAVRELINPRQATLVALEASPLSSFPTRSDELAGGPAPGDVLPNFRVERPTPEGWAPAPLYEVLGTGFALLVLGDAPLPLSAPAGEIGMRVVIVSSREGQAVDVLDRTGEVSSRLCPGRRAFYLVRPDHHVAARWSTFEPAEVEQALAIATGRAAGRRRRPCGGGPPSPAPDHAEAVFEALGAALDTVPAGQTELFLCKLCLLLALEAGDRGKVTEAIDSAKRDLS